MSKPKTLFIDVETTGLDARRQDVIQLAALVEIDGHVVEEFNSKVQPVNWDTIDMAALLVTGTTMDALKLYPPAREVYNDFSTMLGKYVDKFDRADKFYPAGYNVDFDLRFLQEFFAKQGDKYFHSYVSHRRLDPLHLLSFQAYQGKLALPDFKLETVCKHFGIELKAHDALSDVKATRELLQRLM